MRKNKKNIIMLSIAIVIIIIILVTISIFTSDKYRLNKANEYYNNKNYQQALDLYSKIKNKDSETLQKEEKSSLNKANNDYYNGNYQQALDLYSKVKNKDSETLQKQEKCYMHFNKYPEALKILNVIEESNEVKNSDLSLIYYDQLVCFNQSNDYDNFLKKYKMYKKISKSLILDQVMEGYAIDIYRQLQRYDECIVEIEADLLKYKDDKYKIHQMDLKTELYSCYLSKEDYDKALEINSELIKEQPDNLEFYIGRAVIYEGKYGRKYSHNYLISLRDKFKNNPRLEGWIK